MHRFRSILQFPASSIILLCVLAGLSRAGEEAPAPDLYDRVKRAAVEILVDGHLDGSGWFAEADGVVVTAAHVVGGKRIEVVSAEAGRQDAAVLATDRARDLALLRVPARAGGYPVLPLAANVPAPGQPVFIYGAPVLRHGFLLRATIARKGTAFEYYPKQKTYIEVIHASGLSPVGMSGGPWVNAAGEAIGVASGFMTDGGQPAGIIYGTPLETIRALLQSKKTVETATIGASNVEIWEKPGDFRRRYPEGTEGVVIGHIQEDGPAARAGLKDGDVVIAVDGRATGLCEQFLRLIRAKKPGDEVKLTVLTRDKDAKREVVVTLGKLE